MTDTAEPRVPLGALARYFLKLGATGFGGPIALAGHMQRTLVDERAWISRRDFLDGLALAQLAPGPLAAQLAIYLGYVRGGIAGATVVAFAFILPSLLLVWALAAAYVSYGGLGWMQALFYGIGAAVIGIIARSAYRLTRSTLGNSPVLWSIFAVLAIVTAWTERELVWLFLIAGVIPLATLRRGTTAPAVGALIGLPAATAAAGAAVAVTPLALFWFFAQAGLFVFGSGLAIVPFLYGGLVQEHHWLTDREFLDAVAVAMITPGPVVITVAFIGYLLAGFPGMLASALGVFLPVYLFVVVPAPFFRRHAANVAIQAFVSGVTSAAAGAIAGATIVLARRALVDVWTVSIAVASLAVLTRWRIPELWVIVVAGGIGLWLRM